MLTIKPLRLETQLWIDLISHLLKFALVKDWILPGTHTYHLSQPTQLHTHTCFVLFRHTHPYFFSFFNK